MDNVAHTLAGLALAEAGLERKTALATATLAIGANLPDVDALIYVVGTGVDALAFRRGWTHGVLAMVVLPLLLAAAMTGWDRLVRQRRGRAWAPADGRWLLVLAAIGVWSHPLLDLLNVYGVRLLMPFSDRWFYGDALFIVDPWLWAALGLGVVLARRRAGRARQAAPAPREAAWVARPARVAIGAFAAYALAMTTSSRLGRRVVERQAPTGPAERTMVAPVLATPFRRNVVRELDGGYETGVLTWGGRPRYTPGAVSPRGDDAPGVAAAARTRDGAAFLSWSRFPRFTTERMGDSIRVRMSDVRYTDARGRGWAAVTVSVPAGRDDLPPPP